MTTHDLPTPILRPGERTVFAYPCVSPYRCASVDPGPGVEVFKIATGKMAKFPAFEWGKPEIEAKDYAKKRILPHESLWIHVVNVTDDDVYASGTITFEDAPIPGAPSPEPPKFYDSDEEAMRSFGEHLRSVVRGRTTLPVKDPT